MQSWGYQQVISGSAKATLSGAQPVVVPFYETKSTVDVLLAAVKVLPYEDEVEFIQSKLSELVGADNAMIPAGEIQTFMSQYQQFGGWWGAEDKLNGTRCSANF